MSYTQKQSLTMLVLLCAFVFFLSIAVLFDIYAIPPIFTNADIVMNVLIGATSGGATAIGFTENKESD